MAANSRLERLLVLLSSASTPSARSLAVKQLGGLVRTHPAELDNLLVHLHPLLHSKQWDARIAAVEALEAILKELPTPVKVKKEETDDVRDATEKPKDQTKSRLTFSTFSLSTCLANHGPLEGSQGNEYASSEVNEDTQRQALNKTLGLDMAAKLGIVTDEIFNSDDLKSMSSSKASPNNSNGKSMSAREKNKLKRSRSKIEKTKNLMQKRQKLLLAVYQGRKSQNETTWPLDEFSDLLIKDLFDINWETRHGAATALREVIRLQCEPMKTFGEEEFQSWLEDVILRLVSLMARDRFGDFVSDQVVAPVRESAAQALGAAVAHLSPGDVNLLSDLLEQMMNEGNWECRHGGMLGMKYLLAVRPDLASTIVARLLPVIVKGLTDEADDVVGEAAAALLPVVHCLLTQQEELETLVQKLWDLIKEVDEITSSVHSIMQLLAEILKQQSLCEDQVTINQAKPGESLVDRVPRLFPYLGHPSSVVRKAALSTLHTLTSKLKLAQTFLPVIAKTLMSYLFQRAILEHQDYNLELIESIWNNVCDFTPLGPLLISCCPLYGSWVSLITQPPAWPLPAQMLIREKSEMAEERNQFLGGPHAQQLNDPVEKDRCVVRARHLGAKLLGKLAGFIVQPVPGMDYSKDELSPMEMFVSKILLPNLTTASAYRRTTMCMIIAEWCDQHDVSGVPTTLSSSLVKYLTEPITFEEIMHSFSTLQTDTSDFIATLKHYKLTLPDSIASVCQNGVSPCLNFDQIKIFLTDTDFKAVLSTNAKLKVKVVKTILERLEDHLVPSLNRLTIDQSVLGIMTMAAVAGAVIGLGTVMDKLNPLIKPLMESVKKETNKLLQLLSARKLAKVLEMCVSTSNLAPVEKVIKNLVSFASADPNSTPHFVPDPAAPANKTILTLMVREIESNKKTSKKSNIGAKGTISPSLAAAAANFNKEPNGMTAESDARLMVQTRGAKTALETIINYFHSAVFEKLPKVQEMTLGAILSVATDSEKAPTDLIFCLRAFEIIVPAMSSALHERLTLALPGLTLLLKNEFASLRHMAARCLAQVSKVQPVAVMTSVINIVIPMLESSNVKHRQGAIECLAVIQDTVDTHVIVPFISLLILPVLGRMADLDQDVRFLATNTFASLIKLVPLEGSVEDPSGVTDEIIAKRKVQRKFLDQLMNVKNLEDTKLNLDLDVELRPYQQDGINWLAFLNRYKLHGILCDDMGLGKTLQTICIIAQDHQNLGPEVKTKSLVICPSTLCDHWFSEIIRFLGPRSHLRPLVYTGTPGVRMEKKKRSFNLANVIITSYDVARNDVNFLVDFEWNYVVLDEGQIIRNGKTKTTQAIKRLMSKHRLILSGTPIQNSVLELWSLFDFLMPGFLGTEKQFNAKFSRPIIASRDPKCSAKDAEAGALAMESLHRQVLPFVLRRMKDDVLKDLPPKITQDFYCDLSTLQVKLYEDFAKRQTLEGAQDTDVRKPHVFQALQYLRKVCNHPKLVMNETYAEFDAVSRILAQSGSSLDDIHHSAKLPALRDLLLQCGIGGGAADGDLAVQHRALVFFQLKGMMDIVEQDLLKQKMPSVTYLRLDGSVKASRRQDIVNKFNQDASIDLLLISTSVGGLGLNLTGADTVIFVEHDWNPMKDLQAMDRAHRLGQKKVVNVYRLITRHTIEEKIMGLQKFKIKTANTVISSDNASLQSMATDRLFELFSLEDEVDNKSDRDESQGQSSSEKAKKKTLTSMLEEMSDLWDDSEYNQEYNMDTFITKNATVSGSL